MLVETSKKKWVKSKDCMLATGASRETIQISEMLLTALHCWLYVKT
jgi:hypothetical protein